MLALFEDLTSNQSLTASILCVITMFVPLFTCWGPSPAHDQALVWHHEATISKYLVSTSHSPVISTPLQAWVCWVTVEMTCCSSHYISTSTNTSVDSGQFGQGGQFGQCTLGMFRWSKCGPFSAKFCWISNLVFYVSSKWGWENQQFLPPTWWTI